jgi:hypothetical protein
MRSVWLCSRNDALGIIAVMLAICGVMGTGIGCPALLVAAVMAGLALSGGACVVRLAIRETSAAAQVVAFEVRA